MVKQQKFNIIFIYILILTFFFTTDIFAQSNNKFISISDNWNYNFYQSKNKDFSKPILVSSGQTNLPINFENLVQDNKLVIDRGIVEFTRYIDANEYNYFSKSKFVGIYFGKLIDCSEIFIEGKLISRNGIFKNRYFTSWNKNILVKLQNLSNLNKDKIEIKIKVYYYPKGSVQDYIYFGDYNELKKLESINNFIDIDLKVIFLFISILFSAIFFYIGIKVNIKYYQYFSLLVTQIFLFTIIYVLTDLPIDHSIFNFLFEYKSLYLSSIFLILFVVEYIGKKPNPILKAGIFISIGGFLFDTIIIDRTIRLSIYQIFNIFIYLIFVYLVIHVIIEYIKSRSKNSKDIIIPLIILFLCLTNDFIAFKYPEIIKKLYPQYITLKYLNIYGFQVFVIFIASKLVKDLVESFYKLRILTEELGKISSELEKRKENLAENVQKILDETKESFLISESLTNTGADFSKIIYNLKTQIEKMKEALTTSNINEQRISDKLEQLFNMLENVKKGYENTSELLEIVIEKVNKIIENTNQIDIIVEQTSILSLNSSVVAGKAKEKGKGFSIISEEIRKLAMKSADFSSNAQKGINEILNSVKEARQRSQEFLNTFNKYSSRFIELSNLINNNKDNHKYFIKKIENMDELVGKIELLADEIDTKSKKLYVITYENQNINFEN